MMLNVIKEITDHHIQTFFKNVPNIISHQMGSIVMDKELRKIAVLFDNGDLLVDSENLQSIGLHQYRELCSRKGISIHRIFQIDMQIIRLLYEQIENDSSNLSSQEPMETIIGNLLAEAAYLRVSDIHFKVFQHEAELWFRRNGDMIFTRQIPAEKAHAILAAMYNAAEDADATYRIYDYQAARLTNNARIKLPKTLQAVRLQFNPLGAGGRYLIARLLYAENWWEKRLNFSQMGFHSNQIEIFRKLRMVPEGVNIISGPTGSGKSTTLKALLEQVYIERKKKVNIITIEDPPEYNIHGAVQLTVSNATNEAQRGESYGNAIVAALRSDPDIIMPGEARDATVIGLVFTAAMTGHQVWTSLHANSAFGVFDRLRDQGVEDYKMLDPTLMTGIVSQRLVKKICPHCSMSYVDHSSEIAQQYDIHEIKEIEASFSNWLFEIKTLNKEGCNECNSGYLGRTVVAEVIAPDQKLLDLIAEGKRNAAMQYWQENLDGMLLSEHTWIKVVSGELDPFDIWSRIARIIDIPLERRQALYLMKD